MNLLYLLSSWVNVEKLLLSMDMYGHRLSTCSSRTNDFDRSPVQREATQVIRSEKWMYSLMHEYVYAMRWTANQIRIKYALHLHDGY